MDPRYLLILACPIGMGLMMWMMSRNNSPAPRADLSDLTAEQRLGLLEQRSQQVARELAATREAVGPSATSEAPTTPPQP